MLERLNNTLKMFLKKVIDEEGRDWDKFPSYLHFAYREVMKMSTGFSPFELLLHVRDIRGLLDLLKKADKKTSESTVSLSYQFETRWRQ